MSGPVHCFASSLPGWFTGEGPDADVVISTRIRLARNCTRFPFPQRASLFERKQAYEEVLAAFHQSPQFGGFECINLLGLEKTAQQFLMEERIISPELLGPDGDRGVLCDAARRICIMVNEEDHLRMQSLDSGCRALEMWKGLDAIDDALGMRLEYAYDNRRGFLTSCPTNAGTGLRVSFFMHLPGLILTKTIDQILHGASQLGVSTRGFSGENSSVAGSFFQLSNIAAMGASETEFLETTSRVIRKTAESERTARRRILDDARPELMDKINRAFGILTHASLLDVDEFLNLSSAIRLGIECNLFNPLTVPQLNGLTLAIMPAHLQTRFKRQMTGEELRPARAEVVRTAFSGNAG